MNEEDLKVALANEVEYNKQLESKVGDLAAIIERLTVERDDALAMNRTMLQERTASHDTEYGHVMAKRCAEEFNESR